MQDHRTQIKWLILFFVSLILINTLLSNHFINHSAALPEATPSQLNYLPLILSQTTPSGPIATPTSVLFNTSTPSPTPTSSSTLTPTMEPTSTNTPEPTATATDPGGYDYYLTGNPADVSPATTSGLMLMGGGPDVDAAFEWLIEKSGGGDIVVIRASGSDGYNDYIFSDLGGVDSVETFVINTPQAASAPFVVNTIQKAEALFIAGGDQWDYLTRWQGSPLEDAIHSLVARNVPIGGTSAGLAILGEFVFSAENGTVYSDEALNDPYNQYMTFARDFLAMPYMSGVITDSHFVTRDRMGRLVGFLARLVEDGWTAVAKGIGVDEETAVLVEADGSATLVGSGAAYFLRTPGSPEVCQPRTDLTFNNVTVYRLSAGQTFNLQTWSGSGGGGYTLSAGNGVLTSSQAGGNVY
jgi:cyanophycinase